MMLVRAAEDGVLMGLSPAALIGVVDGSGRERRCSPSPVAMVGEDGLLLSRFREDGDALPAVVARSGLWKGDTAVHQRRCCRRAASAA
ncbi:hypothetical protein ACLOJK_009323 [Asimina triloba]